MEVCSKVFEVRGCVCGVADGRVRNAALGLQELEWTTPCTAAGLQWVTVTVTTIININKSVSWGVGVGVLGGMG